MTTVELLAPHEHAGTALRPGTRIDLPDTVADWLISQAIARPLENQRKSTLLKPTVKKDETE